MARLIDRDNDRNGLGSMGGLITADPVGLTMPMLRPMELNLELDRALVMRSIILAGVMGAIFGLVSVAIAHVIGSPKNPGTLLQRLLTTPVGAVVTQVVAHLLLWAPSSVGSRIGRSRLCSVALRSLLFFRSGGAGSPIFTNSYSHLTFCLQLWRAGCMPATDS